MAIHLIDELDVQPGHLDAVQRLVDERYAPLMSRLGATAGGRWLDPAVVLHDRPTTLLLVWHLPDTASYWTLKRAGSGDPEARVFWDEVERHVTGRRRRITADANDPAVLR
jgi:hypothetical protein